MPTQYVILVLNSQQGDLAFEYVFGPFDKEQANIQLAIAEDRYGYWYVSMRELYPAMTTEI